MALPRPHSRPLSRSYSWCSLSHPIVLTGAGYLVKYQNRPPDHCKGRRPSVLEGS
jgi:hypothetical protein